MTVTLRSVLPGEAAELTELVMRSKAYWGYDAEFLNRVRPELTLEEKHLESTIVAEYDGRAAGIATLDGEPPEGELYFLFVDPWAIGKGVGEALFRAAVNRARAQNFTRLLIDSDPGAEGFYLRMGAIRIGERVSPSSGRSLPLLAYDI